MTTEAIKALVGLRKKIISRIEVKAGGMIVHGRNTQLDQDDLITIVNAIEALKPKADVVMVPDLGATVSKETEAALKAIDDNIRNAKANGDKILVGAPAPVDDVRLAKALEALTMIAEANPIWNGGVARRNADQWRELYSELKTIASDTLAAINGEK